MMKGMDRSLTMISRALVAVGGINWGSVGLFDVDLVATAFGRGSKAARTVYTAVGIATVYTVVRAAVRAGGQDGSEVVDPAGLSDLAESGPLATEEEAPHTVPM